MIRHGKSKSACSYEGCAGLKVWEWGRRSLRKKAPGQSLTSSALFY